MRRPDFASDAGFSYPEAAFEQILTRGGARSDRCVLCRRRHRMATSAFAVGFVDVATVGPVDEPSNPTGPLGSLGPLPAAHDLRTLEVTEPRTNFGMSDQDISEILRRLRDKQVVVVKAGTGTGKSTFMPFRLAFPPEGAARITDNGPIIITEPRVQATVGVATYVATQLCLSAVGPGGIVGYQAQGTAAHDSSNRLVYATDGSAVNWLTQQRHANWGAVIIDEAHERSANIDLILAILKRDLPMYPQLRVIVTSATFDPQPIVEFFGDACAEPVIIDPVKTIGYFPPLYPKAKHSESDLAEGWSAESFEPGDGTPSWDLYEMTRQVERLRASESVPMTSKRLDDGMAGALSQQLIRLCRGLDEEGLEGDILSFLPTRKTIDATVERVRAEVNPATTVVYDLMRDSPTHTVEAVVAKYEPGSPRRVVVATNIAETSLTLDGFRFVVDTGIINSAEWLTDAEATKASVIPHSKSGIRQRWGRVGRTMPGWIFPLYSPEDFDALDEETPPGSLKENLESVVLKAINAGFTHFDPDDWPAASSGHADDRARFEAEFKRATGRLHETLGAIDQDGDLTELGENAARSIGSVEQTIALENADQLNCLPEVAVVNAMWGDPFSTQGALGRVPTWSDQIRDEYDKRLEGLLVGSDDAVELALAVFALWEQSDPSTPPWEPTDRRLAMADLWWMNADAMEQISLDLRRTIDSMSSATRSQKYRPIDFRLADRTRAALAHGTTHYLVAGSRKATSLDGTESYGVDDRFLPPSAGRYVSLSRSYRDGKVQLKGLVRVPEWVLTAANRIELMEAGSASTLSVPLVHAHEMRSHFPIGATVLAGSVASTTLGFHRPSPHERGPSQRDGNFLDSSMRLLKSAGQLLDVDDLKIGLEDDISTLASAPPLPQANFEWLDDEAAAGCIIGYAVEDDECKVFVERDLAPLRVQESLDASDLQPGTSVDLVVGPEIAGKRKLIRADGRGWFIVQSNRPVFQMLDRHDRQFLSRLRLGVPMRGTVVPNDRHGNTVSLLPDLVRRVDALPAVSGSERDGQRLLPATLLSSEPNMHGYVGLSLEGIDDLVFFSMKVQKLEQVGIPVEEGQGLLLDLSPDLWGDRRDPDSGRIRDFRLSRPIPDEFDSGPVAAAGFEVVDDEDGRRLRNPRGVLPDPDLWQKVAVQNPAIASPFDQFAVNSLTQLVRYRRASNNRDVLDAPKGEWYPPIRPTWLGGRSWE